MNKDQVTGSLSELGRILTEAATAELQEHSHSGSADGMMSLVKAIDESERANPWFIPSFVRFAVGSWGKALQQDKVKKWVDGYPVGDRKAGETRQVAVVMAGNLPMVGFHDLLCILASGQHALVKLSSQDDRLIPAVMNILEEIEPEWKGRVTFTRETMKGFDAVIATGSNNTSRYFEYYFGKYPHIIRKNRNGVGVVTGNEEHSWFRALADDIFLYFGLGCRNISKLYLPEGFPPHSLFEQFDHYSFVADHHKYANNYDYQKSVLMINRHEFHDNGFLILAPGETIPSPVSVVHYEYYTETEILTDMLNSLSDQIQCIVSDGIYPGNSTPAGKTQQPELWDYADGIDTMEFLIDL